MPLGLLYGEVCQQELGSLGEVVGRGSNFVERRHHGARERYILAGGPQLAECQVHFAVTAGLEERHLLQSQLLYFLNGPLPAPGYPAKSP